MDGVDKERGERGRAEDGMSMREVRGPATDSQIQELRRRIGGVGEEDSASVRRQGQQLVAAR